MNDGFDRLIIALAGMWVLGVFTLVLLTNEIIKAIKEHK